MKNQALSKPSPIRILLVDDDEDIKPLVEHLLRKIPGKEFHIDGSARYRDALEIIKRQSPDVYLVDYRLGIESGLDLIREANALGIQAPFLVLTGAANPFIDLEATKIGAADFIVKDRLDAISLERSIRYAIQHFETLRALQKSNERFRLLFERSMDAILVSDDAGRFLEANSAACALLGYEREPLFQKKISDVIVPELAGGSVPWQNQAPGELTLTQPDGSHRFVEFSAYRFAPDLNLCILRDITERRKLEKEIQEISEREQRRLGQDLHDGIGQMLTGINFLAKVLEQKLTTRQLDEAREARNIVSLINQTLAQTRELARSLCPVVLENNDIHAALQQLADHLEKLFKVQCQLICDTELQITENPVAVHLYRIAQEATTNAIKHGKAKNVRLSLVQANGYMTLRVQDDGTGLPKTGWKNKGMGLRVMLHRARMIGGTLEIEAAKPTGTVVICKLEYAPTVKGTQEVPVKKKRTATKH